MYCYYYIELVYKLLLWIIIFPILKMKHEEYEKGVVRIEDTLANQTQELDELSKLSTIAFNRNTVLEREVRELRKRLTTTKSELQVCNIMYYIPHYY